MIGSTEIIVVAAVALVIFGGSAIPRFARSLGKAKREFEEGMKEGAREAGVGKGEEEKATGGRA